MNKSNKTYWIIFACIAAAILAFLLYLAIRPFSHKPDEGTEDSLQTANKMKKPSSLYDTTKRGYRNNNPLNIRLSSNKWVKEVRPSADKEFCQFETMAYGFRAAMVCIRTYITKHKCTTLEQIINRWAPWSDGNNPVRYCQRVMSRWPEHFPNKEVDINYKDREQMACLVFAMAIVENGSEPLLEDCYQAFALM